MMKRRYFVAILSVSVLCGIGLFFLSKTPKAAPRSNEQDIEMLKALPYVQWTDRKANPLLRGVTKYDPRRSFQGVNLYTSSTRQVFLVDMKGKSLHTWSVPNSCQHAVLLDHGEILAVSANRTIMKLDWNSRLIWKAGIAAHHDVAVLPNRTILTLVKEQPVLYNSYKVMFDSLAFLSPSGDILERWSVFANLAQIKRYHPPHFLDHPLTVTAKPWEQKARFDYYHMNTINILPETPLSHDPRFRAGNLLVCFRNVSLIAILDKASKQVVWAWGPGELDYPHMPTMLGNGNILIFDNGTKRKYSRIIELDPVENKVVWEYKASPPKNFFTAVEGSAQRLPNGNTLICHSGKGHAFEVDSKGEIVWEFWNPEIRADRRRRIYRLIRYDAAKVTSPSGSL